MKTLLFVIYIIFTSLGLTLMKLGGNSLYITIKNDFNFKIGFITLLGFFFYIMSFILWQKLIISSDLSYIIPISAAVIQIISLIIAVTIFGEKLNQFNIGGVILIIVGVFMIMYGRK